MDSSDGDNFHLTLLDGGTIDYFPHFLSKEEADALWDICKFEQNSSNASIPWSHDVITVSGRTVLEPRVTAFVGERDGLKYTYSKKLNVSRRWPDLVQKVKERIETIVGEKYNVVLMNYYRDGNDHVSWHSDSEVDLKPGVPIASLSIGATRLFQLRHHSDADAGRWKDECCKKKKEGMVLTEKEEEAIQYTVGVDPKLNFNFELKHGDLLLMGGTLQKHWRHRVPQKKEVGPRICFTFRAVQEAQGSLE